MKTSAASLPSDDWRMLYSDTAAVDLNLWRPWQSPGSCHQRFQFSRSGSIPDLSGSPTGHPQTSTDVYEHLLCASHYTGRHVSEHDVHQPCPHSSQHNNLVKFCWMREGEPWILIVTEFPASHHNSVTQAREPVTHLFPSFCREKGIRPRWTKKAPALYCSFWKPPLPSTEWQNFRTTEGTGESVLLLASLCI
jgi:hypothetical protein